MIAGVVLAAGTSSRMGGGRHKLLLPLAGKPVLQHVLDAAVAGGLVNIVVVLGRDAEAVTAAIRLRPGTRPVTNPRFADGHSTSVVAGIRALPDATAAMFLLGDQPGVSVDAIAAVAQAFGRSEQPIVQAAYGGRPGHPTLIGRELFPELEALVGDDGARTVIERHRDRRVLVEVGGDRPEDIDTDEDYRRATARFERPPDRG